MFTGRWVIPTVGLFIYTTGLIFIGNQVFFSPWRQYRPTLEKEIPMNKQHAVSITPAQLRSMPLPQLIGLNKLVNECIQAQGRRAGDRRPLISRRAKASGAVDRLQTRRTNIAPPPKVRKPEPCREGSKQAALVDILSREEGASMAELLAATSGGNHPWIERTVRSAFSWDLKQKGYGVRSEVVDGVERFFLVLPPKAKGVPEHRPLKGREG